MKKVLLALTIALMATSAFAIPVALETTGLLQDNSVVGLSSATALSFGVTKDITVALGLTSVTEDKIVASLDDPDAANTITGIYLNGFYKLLQSGNVSQSVGLEISTVSGMVDGGTDDVVATMSEVNVVYRAAAKVLGEVSILFDVALLSNASMTVDGDGNGAVTTILSGAQVGFSVPLLDM